MLHAVDALPSRPLLSPTAPVLRRGDDVVQVGLDPRTAVVLTGRGATDLLARLDGRTGVGALRARAHQDGLTPAEVDAVLAALHAAGLLLDPVRRPTEGSNRTAASVGRGPTVGAARRPAVRLIGLGPLGQQVAALLVGAGVQVYAAELGAGELGTGGRRRGTLPLGELPNGPVGVAPLTLVNHWSKPEDRLVQLTVVAAETVEPDRAVTESLLRADQAHLVLSSAGASVTVGPLVLPGRTACVGCTDLTRRDRDPAWPVLLTQLTGLRLPTPPLLVAWAATVAAAQVLATLQHRQAEVTGATLELDASDYLTRWRAWPRHVACGCAWAAPTEWTRER